MLPPLTKTPPSTTCMPIPGLPPTRWIIAASPNNARAITTTTSPTAAPGVPFFHEIGWLIGQENYLIWMHTRPELVDAITDCLVSFEIEVTRRFLDACHGKLDIAFFGNDFGTQRGLFISPDLFQRFLRHR